MHIKVVSNATPYQYGAILFTYKPLVAAYSYETTIPNENDDFSGGVTDHTMAISTSTRPSMTLLYNSSGGSTMDLPFIWYKEWIDLAASQAYGTPTIIGPLVEMAMLGRLTINQLVPMLSTSPLGGGTVSFKIYAWATEVELDGATCLTMQGLEVSSKVSTNLATASKVAAALTAVHPYFAPLSVASGLLSKAAEFMGFTNSPVVDPVRSITKATLPNLCSSEISTQIENLTLSPSNELTIDPSVAGCPQVDELAVAEIVSKPSIIAVTTWKSTTPERASLFQAFVNPEIWSASHVFYNTPSCNRAMRYLYPSPLAGASLYFGKWRGGITYNFTVVCTPFHTGRLRLTWDPCGAQDYSPPDNGCVYTEIHDISPGYSFEFTPPFVSDAAWKFLTQGQFLMLNTDNVGSTIYNTNFSFLNGAGVAVPWYPSNYSNKNSSNGYIRLEVLNSLSSNQTTADARIIVTARGAPDFEVNDPTNIAPPTPTLTSYYPTTSDYIELQGLDVVSATSPQTITASGDDYKVYMGELFRSFRQLLHRSAVCRFLYADAGSAQNTVSFIRLRQPEIPGHRSVTYTTTAVATGGTTSGSFNYAPLTPLAFFTAAFVGWRGSISERILSRDTTGTSTSQVESWEISRLTNRRATSVPSTYKYSLVAAPTISANSVAIYSSGGVSGTVINAPSDNSSISAILPQYSATIINPANMDFSYDGPSVNVIPYGAPRDLYRTDVVLTGRLNFVPCFQSAGPDFSPVGFLNFPRLSVLASSPAATAPI